MESIINNKILFFLLFVCAKQDLIVKTKKFLVINLWSAMVQWWSWCHWMFQKFVTKTISNLTHEEMIFVRNKVEPMKVWLRMSRIDSWDDHWNGLKDYKINDKRIIKMLTYRSDNVMNNWNLESLPKWRAFVDIESIKSINLCIDFIVSSQRTSIVWFLIEYWVWILNSHWIRKM